MKIVIDIDKELYNYMRTEEYDKYLDKRFDYQIRPAVGNGIPLSEKCGDLTDLLALTDDGMSKAFFDWAKTIMEADTESRKE